MPRAKTGQQKVQDETLCPYGYIIYLGSEPIVSYTVRTVLEVFAEQYLTDDAVAKLCDVKFRQIEGNGRKFRFIQLSNSGVS